jgi:hypothetical protein
VQRWRDKEILTDERRGEERRRREAGQGREEWTLVKLSLKVSVRREERESRSSL